ncbi:hypothetical protein MLD38_033933 [Melastoma candidum]|uniref:Uncharacterized protein n=1 Tax=Melastoma candidum TaxID=119954 RepID=A0ACB9MAY5_9MYRT|nr:hypothetical protein MLD38_033933 [Melastoma candidum]
MGWTSVLERSAPFIALVMLEFTDVGIATLSKAASRKGLASSIAVVYYNALGTLILLPIILFLRRKQATPLSFSLLLKFFLLSFVGTSGQILYLEGVEFSSPTLSSAIANLMPIFTLILAVCFRIEKLELRSSSSQAKILGAIVSVLGAMCATLYKGPAIHHYISANHPVELLNSLQSRWVFGGLILTVVSLEAAIWNIFMTAMVKEFPEQMTVVFFFTFFTTIQGAVFCLMTDRSPESWKLTSRIEIIFVVYTAIFGSVFRIVMRAWCLHRMGPLVVTMFCPLGVVIAVIMSIVFLGDPLHVGSVVGSVVIALGFYAVMWGKHRERTDAEAEAEDTASSLTPSATSPLLEKKGDGGGGSFHDH